MSAQSKPVAYAESVDGQRMKPGILYVSYDGMLEPLGQSQVLAYLERLAVGRRVHLISYEKSTDWSDRQHYDRVRRRIAGAGICWHPLRYHKDPSALATSYDIAVGAAIAIALSARHRLNLVHARSYVPGLIALAVKRATGARFLFDMRGFWADERVDGDLWRAGGKLYRAAKSVERRLLAASDHIITLTQAADDELRRFSYLSGRLPPTSVIPTCADLERFTIQGPLQCDPFILGHVGSVGTWYLLDEMLRCFVELRRQRPGARLLIANRGEHDMIRSKAREHRIGVGEIELISVPHAEVPAVINRMGAGLAIIKPAYSKMGSAPTKLAEYLGCGVPCLGNAGVGDMKSILRDQGVGVALPDFTQANIEKGVTELIELAQREGIQQRCRDAAVKLFALEAGVAAYDRIYRGFEAQQVGGRS